MQTQTLTRIHEVVSKFNCKEMTRINIGKIPMLREKNTNYFAFNLILVY
jgi:hypothetical protein